VCVCVHVKLPIDYVVYIHSPFFINVNIARFNNNDDFNRMPTNCCFTHTKAINYEPKMFCKCARIQSLFDFTEFTQFRLQLQLR